MCVDEALEIIKSMHAANLKLKDVCASFICQGASVRSLHPILRTSARQSKKCTLQTHACGCSRYNSRTVCVRERERRRERKWGGGGSVVKPVPSKPPRNAQLNATCWRTLWFKPGAQWTASAPGSSVCLSGSLIVDGETPQRAAPWCIRRSSALFRHFSHILAIELWKKRLLK